MTNKRAIPEGIKRKVRKRCNFGCVICGNPIIEYEHIVEYHKVKEHKEENITLLCSEHHTMVTKGLISKKIVINSNKKPYNNDKLNSKAIGLMFEGSIAKLHIGTNTFMQNPFLNGGMFTCLEVNSKKIIYFEKEEDMILFSCFIFNKKGVPIFAMYKNELVFSLETWDVTWIGRTLKIREDHRKVVLDISFGENIRINKMNSLIDGQIVVVENGNLTINGNTFKGAQIINCDCAIKIQLNQKRLNTHN